VYVRAQVVQDMTGFGLRSHRPLFSVLAQVTTPWGLSPDVHFGPEGIGNCTRVLQVTQSRNANYPQVLKQLIVINAPRVVDLAWGLVKPFLRERTRKKVEIKREKLAILLLKEKMAPYVAARKRGWCHGELQGKLHVGSRWCSDCIPMRYGGEMEDPPMPQMVPVADYLASSVLARRCSGLHTRATCARPPGAAFAAD
jgi:hypothetical protein